MAEKRKNGTILGARGGQEQKAKKGGPGPDADEIRDFARNSRSSS